MNLGILDQKGYELLQSTLVEDLQRRDYELVTVDPSETAINALKILADNKISSAPVFDTKRQVVIGTISVMDLAVWIVRTYAIAKGDKDPIQFDIRQLHLELNTSVREVLNWGLDPFWPVPGKDSLLSLINNFMKWRVHRVPVVGEDRHITGSISQSDVVRFLYNHRGYLESVMNKTLKELDLEEGGVVSVLDTEPLIKAFGAIVENQFTGLAVTDTQGRLVGNISASDLKGLTLDNFNQLNVPIMQFLSTKKKQQSISVTRNSTMSDVVSKLTENKVHRVFVVDETNKLLNIISMTSVMKAFSTTKENPFAGGRVNFNPEIAV
jgi:CBS domain-containing protein